MTVLHPLLMLGLHFVPLLLLSRIEEPADLRVGTVANLHHLGVAILLGKRGVLVQALHLGVFRLKGILHFRLLLGAEFEMFRQFPGPLSRVGRAVMPATVVFRGR